MCHRRLLVRPDFPDADPDVRLVPDYATLKLAPWASVPRAFAIHDCVELDGTPCAFSARSLLETVVARYTAQGLTPVVAPEIEFYLTAPCVDPDIPLSAPLARNGRAEAGQSAFSMNMLNELAPFWDEFRTALDGLGIQADTWIHEVGTSQYEINLMHGDPLAVADQAFLFKYAAKEIAIRHGLNAVFMAKPIAGAPGSSMHLHQSVVDAAGRNIFSDDAGAETAAFGHFIAGLQTYGPDLMLVFAPFVNSYRRFIAGTQAPINLEWGYDNRTAGLRIPKSGPAARRVETGSPVPMPTPTLRLPLRWQPGWQDSMSSWWPRKPCRKAPTPMPNRTGWNAVSCRPMPACSRAHWRAGCWAMPL